ncbi:MAG: cob(I)yrinic acid a,c-diamide adenosyltransferase [Desulfobulbaceae bacterium S3730MH12]|nr:MAG: cob(I)yrinic acid a,c-diamide adenosyltransferase [Desulfobulbaceae bacterium S5133MH15]OEU58505.1 MAG: cob(I)yrinic acid a,c-diamide adenosyltransferase [Desulfobulbaceae bacterium S3730MH12]OEU78862.1 MAG: cob(I)yrinic acid a,c-diamide adenosyltransferase [Desulfobulbaceae bacterium C00003063]
MSDIGRIIVNTGKGKGKTAAALGTAFRALGHGHKVCMIQFLKGQGKYGERLMAEKFDNLDWFICGRGFVFRKENIDDDRKAAQKGFQLAKEKVESDQYDLIILDEITYLIHYNFVDVDQIIKLIRNKPKRLSLILTGRDADPKLIEVADTVSSIDSIKHAYDKDIKAQKGIEF